MVPIIPKQRQQRPNAAKRFNSLINYLQGEREKNQQVEQGAEHGSEPGVGRMPVSNEFNELLDYATAPADTRIAGEKCIAVRTHGVSSIETASMEMNAVARMNLRVEDPVYHFILSWPEHEKPAPELIFDAAQHAVQSLGFAEHQYVIAVHANTDNIHCHVAMNRVHPTTFKSRNIEWAKRTLHYAARESEIKHGWTHDNGIYVVEVDGHGKKQIVLNTKRLREAGLDQDQELGAHIHPDIEPEAELPAWHDPDGLRAWLKGSVAKALKQSLPDLQSWQALHVWLDKRGIALQDTGGGGMRLRAVSVDTGEILELPASQGLRALKRDELEKRWGAFTPVMTFPVLSPEQSHLTPAQLEKGVNYVLGLDPNGGKPPPDHILGLTASGQARAAALSEGGRGLHAVPGGALADDGQIAGVLLQGAVQGGLDNRGAGQDQSLRGNAAGLGEGDGRREERVVEGGQQRSPARKPRDPAKRAERAAEREAQRADLRRRFSSYRNLVRAGDSEHFLRLKELRAERSKAIREANALAKAAKAAVPKVPNREPRLQALVEIEAEASRRKLEAHAKFEQRAEVLRKTRVPPLGWREWLYEQSNLGDKAALSALRGIVYQARRDAKFEAEEDELEDEVESVGAEYAARQHKKLMQRLLAEERKEVAIRAASVHRMRPHEIDALVLLYAGLTWRVTGNGNVEYSSAQGEHMFTDRGNRVTFDRVRVSDDEIKLALAHSRDKFGRALTLTGDDEIFAGRMARLADDMGLKVLNPELQDMLQAHRQAKRADAAVRPVEPAAEEPLRGEELEAMAMEGQGVDKLRAMVLAVDPKAVLIEASAGDESRVYSGPVVAEMTGDTPMFAQHIGRGVYAVHRILAPDDHADRLVEVRYRAGTASAAVDQAGRSQER